MGIYLDNNRFPDVDTDTDTYTWVHNGPGKGGTPLTEPVVVEHIKNDDVVEIQYNDETVDVPLRQVRWLAEVLLQITDFYREEYISSAHDDYLRDGKPGENR